MAAAFTYVLFHKPPGCLTERRLGALGSAERLSTAASLVGGSAAPTVFDVLPPPFGGDRLRSCGHVGRLDRDTGGLLLLTDDGQLASALIDPTISGSLAKAYEVRVSGLAWTSSDAAWLQGLAGGVVPPTAPEPAEGAQRGELLVADAEPPVGCGVSAKAGAGTAALAARRSASCSVWSSRSTSAAHGQNPQQCVCCDARKTAPPWSRFRLRRGRTGRSGGSVGVAGWRCCH